VLEFLEKTGEAVPGEINAGAYVLERSVLELLAPGRPASIERDVFPRLVGDGLYGYVGEGYWLDIGTPERYLQGTADILAGTVRTGVRGGPALIARDAAVADGARVGDGVVLGAGVRVGSGSTLERAVVFEGATIGAGCTLRDCVVAAGAHVGDGTRVEGNSMLGEGVRVGAGNVITHGARLFPGVEIPDGGILF
jgi:mannose-1-phosphate guanylyltransferase